jgi:hypothetical protein
LKPETPLFLEKSRELLDQAETMLGVGVNDAAVQAARRFVECVTLLRPPNGNFFIAIWPFASRSLGTERGLGVTFGRNGWPRGATRAPQPDGLRIQSAGR